MESEGSGRSPSFPCVPCLDGLALFVYGRTVWSRRCLWALALGIAAPPGCGPVEYLARVNSRAALALAQAKQAGAEDKAPYEYVKAVEYLRKARKDAAHAHFDTAVDWGRRSEDCSQRAITLATQSQLSTATAGGKDKECGAP